MSRPTDAPLSAPILPALMRFAPPNMAAMLAAALAAVAETACVGSVGVPSLAGMALVFPMLMLQRSLSGGARGGGGVGGAVLPLGRAGSWAVRPEAVPLFLGMGCGQGGLGWAGGLRLAMAAVFAPLWSMVRV